MAASKEGMGGREEEECATIAEASRSGRARLKAPAQERHPNLYSSIPNYKLLCFINVYFTMYVNIYYI